MQPFEIVLLAAVGLTVFVPVIGGFRPKRARMAAALVIAMTTQIIFGGFRWQLIPLYLAALGLAAGDLIAEDRRVRGWLRVRRGILGVPGVAALMVLPLALPIPELPTPAGPFAVGTSTLMLTDSDRTEIYGPDAEAPRKLMVQVWYPIAETPDSEPVRWNPDWDVVGPALSRRIGFPSFALNHLGKVSGHAYEGAAPLSGLLPVVIYSHGWTGFRTIALNQVESLASRGYMVFAPDHTYGAIATRFPDGEVRYFDPEALPPADEVPAEDYEEASTLLMETFTGDIVAILDALELGRRGPLGSLASHADLERIGIYGHSTGGGAATMVCLSDARCSAVLGMDAWVEPIPERILAKDLEVPSLYMRSDGWRGTPNDGRLRGIAERSRLGSYWMGIEGANHNDFVLTPAFSPVASRLGLKGPIPSASILGIIDRYLVGFFDHYLMELGDHALTGPPPEEVIFEVIPP